MMHRVPAVFPAMVPLSMVEATPRLATPTCTKHRYVAVFDAARSAISCYYDVAKFLAGDRQFDEAG